MMSVQQAGTTERGRQRGRAREKDKPARSGWDMIYEAARATGYRSGPWRQRLRFLAEKIPQQKAWEYALAWVRYKQNETGRKPALLYFENCLLHWLDDEEAGLDHEWPPDDGPQAESGLKAFKVVNVTERDSAAAALWQRVLEALQPQVTRPNYETWLRNTTGFALEGEKLIIAAPNEFAAGWLTRKLMPTCSKVLAETVGRAMQIEMVVGVQR
jgi:hypothetical protein